MSAAHFQPARLPLPLNDKDTPSYPSSTPDPPNSTSVDPKRVTLPSSPTSPAPVPCKQDKSDIPQKCEPSEKSPSPEPPKINNVCTFVLNQLSRLLFTWPSFQAVDAQDGQTEKRTDEIIDMETFQQIVDLDEDDTRDFSTGMVEAYFDQAAKTFQDMDGALCVDISIVQLFSLNCVLESLRTYGNCQHWVTF